MKNRLRGPEGEERRGTSWKATETIQVRDKGEVVQQGSMRGTQKWSDSAQNLEEETSGFTDWLWVEQKGRVRNDFKILM